MENRLIAISELCRILSISETTVFRCLKKEGNGFPRPVRMANVKKFLWRMSDVVKYVETLGLA